MNKVNFYLFALSVVFLFSGCAKAPVEGEVLAKVGGEIITVNDFNERISNLPVRYQEVVKKRKHDFLQEIIKDRLLYQEALREGLDKDAEVLKVMEEAKIKILISRLLNDRVDEQCEVTADAIANEYKQNREEYLRPEIMRVSHILVPTREEALGIADELEGGIAFSELARARSIDPTAQRGGDIGYFPKGQLMPEFENACATLKVGEISGPVKTKLGYHIIKLTDRKEPDVKPINEVTEEITVKLKNSLRKEKFNALVKGLKEGTEIEINEQHLKEEQL